MEKLVDEGLVKAIGLSNFNKQQLQRMYEKARIKPANLQVSSNYIIYRISKVSALAFRLMVNGKDRVTK